MLVAMYAFAGTVRLVSNTWDNVPRVEVMTGLDAPDRGQLSSYTNVRKGTVLVAADNRLCFRRSGDPSRPDSPLTEWRCADKGTSGTYDFNLY